MKPEYKVQVLDSYSAAYCLYIISLTKVLGMDFKSAVLILYFQTISLTSKWRYRK